MSRTTNWIDPNSTDIDECLTMLVRSMAAANELHLSISYPCFEPYTFGIDKGQKYSRVWVDHGTQRFVCFFVQRDNGDVWKAAGWKKPALNFTRGNILTMEGRRDFVLKKINFETGHFYSGI
jgi:hypothetical protein